MDEAPSDRIKDAEDTIAALKRLDPEADPTPEDIAALHELHAEHERKHGRHDRADEAEERARRVRERAARHE
jgi:hypothetical protein